jgi:hypothetical protein
MVVKMASTNGGSLAVLTGLEAGNLDRPTANATTTESSHLGDGDEEAADGCVADHSDDEQGADMEGSEDSDSMDFDDDDDDDDGSDLMSNTTLGDDITAQLAAAGNQRILFLPMIILFF